ncbi:flagellar hook-associated protein FlgL [Paenibacillus flagellatus]|uniref:Flagellar biosynthesis protein FlgL n=1 Tax=Paenibacillus flagellatus TaxID=2211139 RepID=A0A2V5KKM9_9BACL|nr:flagellar hook-associated protein FlgL [Paenibacillus flagellatus]PYI51177.1 flagellar biosynthesis protein FlgL [Paenibacillus flagellatus]
MPFRVTQNMMNTQLLRNLNNNMVRSEMYQNQLATGRRINKPSDDPVGISFAMRYRSELSANDQYQDNADGAISFLTYTDTMMDQAGSVVQRLRELAVNMSNGTHPQQSLDIAAQEVQQLYEQMVDIGNSQFNGKYVFNGQKTDLKPYTLEKAQDEPSDDGIIQFEIGAGVRIPINVTGNKVFGLPTDEDNMYRIMNEFTEALKTGNFDGINSAIGKIDSRMTKMLDVRSDIGAKTNRVELASERLKDISLNVSELQSKTEDADMSIVITNLKMNENVYQASLSAGSKLIQPSLVDFLK